jgi:pimeloyl-ACP methyl ester carboxylesterase
VGLETKRAQVGAIELAYETFGSPADPPLVLVMGLATQMIAWPVPFCEALAADGRFVVRFDNRDCGLSAHLSHLPAPSPLLAGLRLARAPYSIADMAYDTVGLLDALGLDVVDLVGVSMGGFIAQTVALEHPARLRTLTLMMTSTGSRWVGGPNLPALRRLSAARQVARAGREGAQDAAVAIYRVIGGRGYPIDEPFIREIAGQSYDRGLDPYGDARQLAACFTQQNRSGTLRTLRVPTLVIHGLDDPLISSSGGYALARAIPRARLVSYQGLGHNLPPELWADLASLIGAHTRVSAARGDGRRSAG